MNFLAHLYLSFGDEQIMTGNFIGDSVKGNILNRYPPGVQTGIRLHRAIDRFTDVHPVVEQSKNRLRKRYAKYSGVVVDIFYDHFLAAGWEKYAQAPLAGFTKSVHEILSRNIHLLPERSRLFFLYMRRYNIPFSYSAIEVIKQVLTGMSRRTKFESNMQHAAGDLVENYTLFEQEFNEFFPLLKSYAAAYINLAILPPQP